MSFSFDKFLRPITATDRNIKIYEDSGKVRYIINPFHIRHLNVSNNILRMSLESDRNITIPFSTNNEAKIALSKLQSDIDLLQQKVPFMIDKDILNYVTAHIQIGPTGSAGTSGTSGISKIYTATSSTYLQIPPSPTQSGSGTVLSLQTQAGLGFVPGQTIVVYKDFPSNYLVDDYFDEDGPIYMIGDIDTYSYNSGELSFIPYLCKPVGATSSFWYINLTGQVGEAGTSGTSGTSGTGQSAYELWLESNPGQTEAQFLDSLVGAQGPKGSPGDNGLNGENGTSGTSGLSGLSAYEIWLESNPGQTEVQFLNSLVGAQGPKGSPGDNGLNGENGTSGTSGIDGTSGTSGIDGTSGTSGTSGTDGTSGTSGSRLESFIPYSLGSTLNLTTDYTWYNIKFNPGLSPSIVTLNLPDNPERGTKITIKDSDGELINGAKFIVSPASGQRIDMSTSPVEMNSRYQSLTLVYTDTAMSWFIVKETDVRPSMTITGSLAVYGSASFTGVTTFQEVSEVVRTEPGATSSIVVYDFSTGSNWYHSTASSNYTANFVNVPIDDNRAITATIIIDQGATGYSPTDLQIEGVTQTIKWAAGTYSTSANKVDVIGFTFIRTGSSWSQVLGQISSFG